MRGKLIRRDGELLIVIPADVAARENIQEGTEVEVSLARDGLTLEELVEGITDENRHAETDWDADVGKERGE